MVGKPLGSLLKFGLPWPKADTDIQNEIFGSKSYDLRSFASTIHGSGTTAFVISNDETIGITSIIKYLEDFGILLKIASEAIENQVE